MSGSPRRGPRRASSPAARAASPPRPARRSSRSRDGVGGDHVEGRRAVYELLRARRRVVRRVLMAENQDPSDLLDAIEREAQLQRVPLQLTSRARLDREAATEGHQGVVAFAAELSTQSLEDLLDVEHAFLLVCDGITDPRNLGAMLRSADGAGVTGVVLPRHRSARVTPAVAKTAVGAIEYLNFCDVGGVPTTVEQLNRRGVLTVGLDGDATTTIYELDLASSPVALVVGGEEKGLSLLTRKRCATVVSIPQSGRVSSLNASVAMSVASFEVARQRRNAK